MFSNRKWQQLALALNLAGTILLFYSFQATSSDFKLVTASGSNAFPNEKQYALCIENRALLIAASHSGMMIGGHLPECPNWEASRAAAVVNIEHPDFEGIGFTLLIIGFALQYLAVPQPKTIAEVRRELKEMKS